MKNEFLIIVLSLLAGCNREYQTPYIKSDLRAPAYPLVTIDPYTSAWSFTNNLYDDHVRHWTGEAFPLTGTICVDGENYRFIGVEDTLEVVASTAKQEPWTGRYIHKKPVRGWEKIEYDDKSWQEGKAAFGSWNMGGVNTPWEGDNTDIWVRREIILDEDLSSDKSVKLEYSHDDCFELYINGIEVVNTGYAFRSNVFTSLPEEVLQTLKKGKNVIAAHCHNTIGGALVDFGLYRKIQTDTSHKKTAVQQSVDVQATQTYYHFTCGPVDLKVVFTAPLLMNDLELLSRPVNYLSYEIIPTDGQPHQVEMNFEASPAWALDRIYQESISETYEKEGLVFLKTGSKSQNILEKSGDNVRIDWGYFYLCAEKSNATCKVADSKLSISQTFASVRKHQSGKIMLGYDDLYSIQYFGKNLRPYWNREGNRSIESVFTQANTEFARLKADCNKFDYELISKAAEIGGKEYSELCVLAYRQALAAHKLVQSPDDGALLYFSKENSSNGCIGTVDVTFPASPLFLLYNPELLKGMLNPIFHYSESGKWKHPVAAHDLGAYPKANGQGEQVVMPVEECGNMLILTAALAVVEGNAGYAEKHWETLTDWMNYLMEKGLDPENQLCTDDFAGHLAHNANLSVKAILGIASYGKLAEMLGKKDIAETYINKAKEMSKEWVAMADDGDHFRLAFDRPDTWSQKYNLVWDKILNYNLFPESVVEKEVNYYLTVQNEYGLPLDSRMDYTKSDWVMWTATLAQNKETFEQFVHPLYRFMNETTDRLPMTDWYYTNSQKHVGFSARSVVGGYFMKMLEEKLKKPHIGEYAGGEPSLAQTPPMGWNCTYCLGTEYTEDTIRKVARFVEDKMKKFGYRYIILDLGWSFEEGLNIINYHTLKNPPQCLDKYGRLIPNPVRFPSSAGGKGFKPLADDLHRMGLKLGIHVMRGVPWQAADRKTPIKGSSHTADEIASDEGLCGWFHGLKTVNMSKPGAQEYYNSIFEMYAEWGIDFVKVDDIAIPYAESEITAVHKAIEKTGRPIILEITPGPSPIEQIEHLRQNANLWRINTDFYDHWRFVEEAFGCCRKWQGLTQPGHWTDCDLLPFGGKLRKLGFDDYLLGVFNLKREEIMDEYSRFTDNEKQTVLTLWSIFRSPIILSGYLPEMTDFEYKLLTNSDVIAMNQHCINSREIRNGEHEIIWTADHPETGSKYAALFNLRADKYATLQLVFSELDIVGKYRIRDIWNNKTLGVFDDAVEVDVPPHGCILLELKNK